MLKILYVANNYKSSYHTLKRFIDTYSKYYNIKTAAYSKSIQDLNVSWNLDALLDFTGRWDGISFRNSNYDLYVREIKKFAPDLIISDVEIYTSYIGIELGIPVWQVSPLLLYHGINVYQKKLYKYYSAVITKNFRVQEYISHILNNSDKRLVLSHLGDYNNKPTLKSGYEWVRPNYELDGTPNMANAIELADAYFANTETNLPIDYTDPESILASYYNKYCGLSGESKPTFETVINNDIKFLSQYLQDFSIA